MESTAGATSVETLMKAAKRQWAWEDLLAIPIVLAILWLGGPTSPTGVMMIVFLIALMTVQQRITKRLDAIAQLLERMQAQSR